MDYLRKRPKTGPAVVLHSTDELVVHVVQKDFLTVLSDEESAQYVDIGRHSYFTNPGNRSDQFESLEQLGARAVA